MTQDFINIPVPRDRVQDVYELLARIAIDKPAQARQSGRVNGTIEWPEDLLMRAYRESPPAMKVVFDYLASHADKAATSEMLKNAIASVLKKPGYKRDQLAGVLGAFGRRWKNRYRRGGRADGAWPFAATWNGDLGMYEYRMSGDVAEVMRRATK